MDAVKKFVVLRKNFQFHGWKVIFEQTYVCLPFCWGRVPCDHYPWSIAPHCTGHQTWDLTVQGPPGPKFCPGPPTGNIWWPSLETCSKLFTSGAPSLVLTSGGYWSTYGQHKLVVHILLECFLVHYWLYVRDGNSAEFLVVSGEIMWHLYSWGARYENIVLIMQIHLKINH